MADFGNPLTAPSACCVHLRCKSMFYRDDERPGLLHREEAMGYWCHRTGDLEGPDTRTATHARCQEGRDCFQHCRAAVLARGTNSEPVTS